MPDARAGLDFAAALAAVDGRVRRTPLLDDPSLSERLGRRVLVKAECLQITGSFKVRGAFSRLGALGDEERRRGVVACSSGNHGVAMAHAGRALGVPITVYVPEWVDPVKLAGIRERGAELVSAGATFDEAEAAAVAAAEEAGRAYVSAYDDPCVIAGQGTISHELVAQLGTPPGTVLAPLSGGGLIGGIAAAFGALEHRWGPPPTIVAVSADNAAVMRASLDAGRPVELPEEDTLASALAGGIGRDNRHSFPLVRDVVDAHRGVKEAAIASAMRYAATRLRLVVEGGGAVGLATLLEDAERGGTDLAEPVVVVLSGGNVTPGTLARVLEGAA